jgi:citrate lyase subunit beta / citryl-CoA lyase
MTADGFLDHPDPDRYTPGARARRSSLSVPGSSAKMLEKAVGLGTDELVVELVDSVAPEA